MKKLAIIVGGFLVVATLIGFGVNAIQKNKKAELRDLNIICLAGVEYYYRRISHGAMLAVKYNATTKEISLCD